MAQQGNSFVIAEYNVENMFDAQHDSLNNDYDFTPEGKNRWTRSRCWRKVNAVARAILSISENVDVTNGHSFRPADVVALCEVENDSVMDYLTRRSLLRSMRYEYIITHSLDPRGIDVAMLYNPVRFRPLYHYPLRPFDGDKTYKTRDILYCAGEVLDCNYGDEIKCQLTTGHEYRDVAATVIDTLHFFVIHAPSRRGGEYVTQPSRLAVAHRLLASVDSLLSLNPDSHIVILGDFNDYSSNLSIKTILSHGLKEPTQQLPSLSYSDESWSKAYESVGGTYKFRGEWGSLDHILVSSNLSVPFAEIIAPPMLLEADTSYGGVKPRRFLLGSAEHNGFSDHLPLRIVINY